MKNILFIVNPVSGTGKQKKIIPLLEKHLDCTKYNYEVMYTKYADFISDIEQSKLDKFDIVVAVGGDGTVNELSNRLTNSNITMGIIPTGSGNGLARHLKLPLKIKAAIQRINECNVQIIDTASINGQHFVNVAGIGFDAHIAHLYADTVKRGAVRYVKLTALEFYKYKPLDYRIIIDGKKYQTPAFLISFANSSQFGNNAYIAPKAMIDDGMLDICIFSKFPAFKSPVLAIRLFSKRIDKSKYIKILRGKNITLKSSQEIKAHKDGEPIVLDKETEVQINPSSLRIII